MCATISAAAPAAPTRPLAREAPRYFYSAAAAILLVLVFLGFQQFYLHGRAFPNRPLAPPILGLLIAHGVAMSAWMLLMVVQPLLVAKRKIRVHRTLGKFGAALAVVIFLLGWRVGISAARVAPPEFVLWGLDAKQFMIVPLVAVTTFAGFVAMGVWKRKRREVHRPMMLLASLAIVAAALDRIPWMGDLYRSSVFGPVFGPFFSTLVIGGAFLVAKCALTRSFDKPFAVGWGILVLISAGTMALARTSLWDAIASFLLQF